MTFLLDLACKRGRKLKSKTSVPFFFFILLIHASMSAFPGAGKVSQYVDPFIGTANGGNTFPGAGRPWGMVSVSPHTDLNSPSGYIHGRSWFYGLGQVHLSGTGCSDLGSIIVAVAEGKSQITPDRYKCVLKDEQAHPGYWSGTIVDPSARLEATATTRSTVIRITPAKAGGLTLLIDAGQSLSLIGGGSVKWTSRRELEGFNIGGGFCGEQNRHVVYFAANFSRDADERGTWRDSTVTSDPMASATGEGVGAWVQYRNRQRTPIEIRIGISYVSIANARLNRDTESGGRSFTIIRAAAENAWEESLSRIRVIGGTPRERTIFYTALYHSLIHPNIISDVNGEYPLFGRTGTGKNTTREHYTVFSLWDTYRTLHPLLTLLYPERQSAIVSTMIDMYKESGWLPKWELAANETHMMVGDGAVPVIADTYLKGIRDFDTLLAYEAMRKPGTILGPEGEPSRPGYAEYLNLGYISWNQDTTRAWWVWGPVSTTLEYCFTDWAFSRVAAAMRKADDAREFRRRSTFYKNLFDTTTGFLRPRRSDGRWLTPFDPLQTEGSGNWGGSGGPGYVEGNAWQYSWFVPHDIDGLARLFGEKERCVKKLVECFAENQFTINNEPDISYPYLFTYFQGHEHRTRALIREIMERNFTVGPAGLPGNDDAGTISAWYVFSALGFYPACPASGEYRLGIPLFDQVSISLHKKYYHGATINVRRLDVNNPEGQIYEVTWNGARIGGFAIDHVAIAAGGELLFTVSP
jgi:predicted alpha-1,2-mannosidase